MIKTALIELDNVLPSFHFELPNGRKYDGYLLEGMACPLGCASGAGTITMATKTRAMVELSKREAVKKHSPESEYVERLHDLME